MDKKKKADEAKKQPAKWVPICRVASAYDFNEETGHYEQSMSSVEIQQNDQTKEVRAVVI